MSQMQREELFDELVDALRDAEKIIGDLPSKTKSSSKVYEKIRRVLEKVDPPIKSKLWNAEATEQYRGTCHDR